ncbi:MAG: hypothetical protein WA510_15545, partial [Acidobacteriaceae bacterium]
MRASDGNRGTALNQMQQDQMQQSHAQQKHEISGDTHFGLKAQEAVVGTFLSRASTSGKAISYSSSARAAYTPQTAAQIFAFFAMLLALCMAAHAQSVD